VERATPELQKETANSAQSNHSIHSVNGNSNNAFAADSENKPLRTLTLLETLAAVGASIHSPFWRNQLSKQC
jgi:hypothetical protein